MPRFLPRLLPAVLACLLALLCLGFISGGQASAATPAVPPLPSGIEPQAIEYTAQVGCSPAFKPGTAALGRLLAATYRGVTVQGAYGCGTDGTVSEHYEGRAIDWMTSLRNRAQAADASALLSWLLATDKAGHAFAMARRLGVMYVIWNNRIWGGWNGKWAPYNNCAMQPQLSYDNACHRTHVHISLTWNGAMGRTTFWVKQIYNTDYGPCRAPDLNLAGRYIAYNPRPCPPHRLVQAPARASTAAKNLVHYSGAFLARGSYGPAVAAVQTVLHVRATGQFGDATQTAVIAFEKAHRLPPTGDLGGAAWRALLAAYGH